MNNNRHTQELSLFSDDDFQQQSALPTQESPQSTQQSPLPPTPPERLAALFERLSHSAFRSRFRLSAADREYIAAKGLDVIRRHAADFIATRLAPAVIPNDGRQTPMRGHPAFKAQHATACCCRGCMEKWHHIPRGRRLTAAEQAYAVDVIMAWIERQLNRAAG